MTPKKAFAFNSKRVFFRSGGYVDGEEFNKNSYPEVFLFLDKRFCNFYSNKTIGELAKMSKRERENYLRDEASSCIDGKRNLENMKRFIKEAIDLVKYKEEHGFDPGFTSKDIIELNSYVKDYEKFLEEFTIEDSEIIYAIYTDKTGNKVEEETVAIKFKHLRALPSLREDYDKLSIPEKAKELNRVFKGYPENKN